MTLRSFIHLGYNSLLYPPLTPSVRAFADYMDKQKGVPPMFGKGAALEMARQRLNKMFSSSRKGKGIAQEEPTVKEAPSVSSRSRMNKKGVVGLDRPNGLDSEELTDLTVPNGDKITLSYPSSARAQSDFEPYMEESEKLMFEEDEARLNDMKDEAVGNLGLCYASQGMQVVIWMRKRLRELVNQVKQLKAQNQSVLDEMKELRSYKEEVDQVKEELQAQLALKTRSAATMEWDFQKVVSKLGEVRAKTDMLEGRLLNLRLDTEIRCRGQLAMEYRDCGSTGWDYSPYITEYEEYLKMQDEHLDIDEAVGSHGSVGSN